MPAKKQSTDILVLRDQAKNQLQQIRTVEDGITYLNKLKAIEVWIKAHERDDELQILVSEQKLRTGRVLGELIPEAQRKGLLKTPTTTLVQNTVVEGDDNGSKTLEDVGITRDQSSIFQTIAAIPTEKFEQFLEEKKQAHKTSGEELTQAGMLRFAKTLVQVHKPQEPQQPIEVEIDPDEEIREMAEDINRNYTQEQRALLISLIKL